VLPDIACDVLWIEEKLLLTGPQQQGGLCAHVGQEVLLLKLDRGAARSILGMPISELTDRAEPLADFHPQLAGLIERHIEDDTVHELVGRGELRGDRFLAASRALASGMKVRATAELVNLGERQLERLFADRAGVRPVMYARISRLHRGVDASRTLPLARAAAVSGYADQSHFSREVRDLTGSTPRSLVTDVGSVQELEIGSFYLPEP
jgi:AraC-like DNA-binding protein